MKNKQRKIKVNNERMYQLFRRELDGIWVGDHLKRLNQKVIRHRGRICGLLCYDKYGYVDCLYIKPEYRKMGIAARVAISFYKKGKIEMLHIINKNKPAVNFWNKLFWLERIHGNEIEGLYKIICLR